jgi:3-dehydroquinate dehydratase I
MILKHALCGCLTDVSPAKLKGLLYHPEVDLLEWRLDVFYQRYARNETLAALTTLAGFPRHPVVATNRAKQEGGVFDGPEALRFEILHKAAEVGAEWVDLEHWVGAATMKGFQSQDARVLLSHHDFSATPDRATLQRLAETMARKEPDAIKITTYAQTSEDNLRVLELIPFGRQELGIEVLAFCMGPLGCWSRLISLMLGSPWAYVQLPELLPAAEGQFMAAELRLLLKRLASVSQE